jgi:hypothetical protein
LWQLSGSATQYSPTNTGVGGPDVIFLTQTIASQNITIMGHSLGIDGNLYAVLQDNTEEDVTPKVSGVNDYTFSVSAQKYTPTITANGINLSDNTPEFCVGQRVTFALNGLPNNVVNMVGNWTLPGEFVNQQYDYSSVCTSYDINYSLLANTGQTSCWYVNQPGGWSAWG